MASGIPGIPLALIGAGGMLVYSGLENQTLTSILHSVASGKKPAQGPAVPYATPATSSQLNSGIGAGLANESEISSDAMKYKGAGYVWDGAPAKGIGIWDCSSFVNWVCGHDLSLPIPGFPSGAYTGVSHGPPTGAWLLWGGVKTVSHNGNDAQPGDLCIWQTHMGIAIGPNEMISAQDEALGTGTSIINGAIPGEALFVRRYLAKTGAVVPTG